MTQRASCSSRRSGRFSFVFCCANSVTCIRLFPFFSCCTQWLLVWDDGGSI